MADQAQDVGGKLYLLGGGFVLHRAGVYPSVFQFATVVGVLIPSTIRTGNFEIALAVEHDGASLMQGTVALEKTAKGGNQIAPSRTHVVLSLPLALQGPGLYTVSAKIGDSERHTWFESRREQKNTKAPQ